MLEGNTRTFYNKYFDISEFPHMLPSAEEFKKRTHLWIIIPWISATSFEVESPKCLRNFNTIILLRANDKFWLVWFLFSFKKVHNVVDDWSYFSWDAFLQCVAQAEAWLGEGVCNDRKSHNSFVLRFNFDHSEVNGNIMASVNIMACHMC